MNDSSHGVGAVLRNANYFEGTPRRKAMLKSGRDRTFHHAARAGEEARMHLGSSAVPDGLASDRSYHPPNQSSRRSARAEQQTVESKGGVRPSTNGNSSVYSATAEHSEGVHQVSHRGHSRNAQKLRENKRQSITGHNRAESISDHVAAGAAGAEERLRLMRAASGVDISTEGEETEFAMPRMSKVYGCELKSQWLDPDNNPIKPSKTLSSYREKLKVMNHPHISYDIDGDGVVGPEDLFMAKRFDIDGNGVLDEEEQQVGKQIIAEQFFAAREVNNDLHLFGEEFLEHGMPTNIRNLANAPGAMFKKTITDLKNIERDLNTKGSKSMKDALTCWNPEIIKHNYFVNKFDTTAWNDFGAPGPRDPNFHLQSDHYGSLDTLKNLRKNKDRFYCQENLDKAKARELKANPWMTSSFYGNKNKVTVAKTAYATNFRLENTSRRDELASARSERGGQTIQRENMFSARKV
jgi:hypothetical protein